MTKNIRLSIITKAGEGSIELEGNLEPIEGKVIDRFFDSLEMPKHKGCGHKGTPIKEGTPVKSMEEFNSPTPTPKKQKAEPQVIPELNSPLIAPKKENKTLVDRVLEKKDKKKPKRYFYSTDDGSDKRGIIDSKTRRALESIFLKAEEGEEVTPDDLEEAEKNVEEVEEVEVKKEEQRGDNSHRDDRYTADITDRNTGKPMEMFRCDYHCPSCGHQDTRFAAIRNSYVKCFKCDTHMALEEAVPGEFSDEFISGLRVPVQDESGAYFIARDFKE